MKSAKPIELGEGLALLGVSWDMPLRAFPRAIPFARVAGKCV